MTGYVGFGVHPTMTFQRFPTKKCHGHGICETFVNWFHLARQPFRSFSRWYLRRTMESRIVGDEIAPLPMTLKAINIHLLDAEHCVFEIQPFRFWVLRLQITYWGHSIWECSFREYLPGLSATSCNLFGASTHSFPAKDTAAIASWETWLAWPHRSLNSGIFWLFLLIPFLDREDGRHFCLIPETKKRFFAHHPWHQQESSWVISCVLAEVVAGMTMFFFWLGWPFKRGDPEDLRICQNMKITTLQDKGPSIKCIFTMANRGLDVVSCSASTSWPSPVASSPLSFSAYPSFKSP